MEAEGYTELLGELADELKSWAGALFYDDRLHDEVDRAIGRFIDKPRLNVLIKLGAERRGLLADVIDAGLNQVKEQSRLFVAACKRTQRRKYQDPYARKFEQYLEYQVSFPPKAVHAADNLMISLHECDALFAEITRVIQQTDSPSSGEGKIYTPRFEPVGYLPKDLCERLAGIATVTLNKYAKGARIRTPRKGQRNFRYSFDDIKTLCDYIIAEVSHGTIVTAARQLLLEIENKSKDQK